VELPRLALRKLNIGGRPTGGFVLQERHNPKADLVVIR
jgi:hypothetical protein